MNSLRFRRRLGAVALILLLISILAGNFGAPPLAIRLAAKVGVIATFMLLASSEASYYFAHAALLIKRPTMERGHWAVWATSGCFAVAITVFVAGYIGLPLCRDVLTSSESRYGTKEGLVAAQDRRFAWIHFDGDDRTFILLVGPYLRIGESYRITYLKRSLVVLDKVRLGPESGYFMPQRKP